MLIAALGWVSYTVISRVAVKGMSPLAASTYAALVGFVLLALALASDPHAWRLDWLNLKTALALVYIATFGTALPYLWFVQGVQKIGPARTAIYINLTPVFGVSLGFLVLGEAIDWSMLLGGLIVIAGVTLTNRSSSS
jgi:drug/metabolite transporter (DMT)-like permease